MLEHYFYIVDKIRENKILWVWGVYMSSFINKCGWKIPFYLLEEDWNRDDYTRLRVTWGLLGCV